MIRQKFWQYFNQQRGDMVDQVCVNTNMSSIYKKYNS